MCVLRGTGGGGTRIGDRARMAGFEELMSKPVEIWPMHYVWTSAAERRHRGYPAREGCRRSAALSASSVSVPSADALGYRDVAAPRLTALHRNSLALKDG
jgi:hypothetical protein